MKKIYPSNILSKYLKANITFIFIFFCSYFSNAQIAIAPGGAANALAQAIAGPGIVVSNVVLNCGSVSYGIFSNGNVGAGNIGIPTGVLLTTGRASQAAGAAGGIVSYNSNIPSYVGSNAADANLIALVPEANLNTCKLEFDLVPICSNLEIKYVFASEEYPDYVCSTFNDAFAFFISGPGFSGTQNMANIPGTGIGVAINSINNGIVGSAGVAGGCTSTSYTGLYVNNTSGNQIEYNGFTVPLTASATVVPCQTYHLKIVIADTGDDAYDSGVFLQQDGISCIAAPVLAINPSPASICPGQSTTLTATGSLNGTYTWTPNNNLSANTGSLVVAMPPSSIVYTVSTTNSCNQIITQTVNISVNPLGTPTLNPVPPICISNTTISIAANPPGGSWSGAGITNTLTGTFNSSIAGIGSHAISYQIPGACGGTDTKTIVVNPSPTASFLISSACANAPITINNTSSISAPSTFTLINWDFGVGSNPATSASSSPASLTYISSGIKTVTLTVNSSEGCTASAIRTVTISPVNTPSINSVAPICNNTSTISLISSPVGGVWAGNGVTNALTGTFNSSVAGNGSHAISYQIAGACGGIDTKTIVVNPQPTVAFSISNACVNASVVLNNSSILAAPSTFTLTNWDFGVGSNPTTSASSSPASLIYISSGVKTVTLTVNSSEGCTASAIRTVTISPSPIANFSTTSVCQSSLSTFSDLSTTTVGIINNWKWDFTNNNSIDDTSQNPTFTYPNSGSVTAVLTVSTNAGCTNSISATVNIWGRALPNFSPNNVCFGTATTFINSTNVTTNLNLGTTPIYNWNFADGLGNQILTGNPAHTYTLGGNGNATYNVTLTATTSNNCVDAITKVVNVYAIPTASFTANQVCFGLPSQMIDASIGNGNVVNNYNWDFLSNGTVDATGVSNPNFIFPAIGPNAVTYTVSTNPAIGLTCTNAISFLTVLVNPNPIANFTFINKCINAQPNTFDGSSSTIAIGTNTNYAWAYGDGGTGTGLTTSHTYATANTYSTTLTVTSDKGCQTNVVKQIEVYKKPIMNIVNSKVCDKNVTSFTATSIPGSGNATDWFWDFNNNITTFEGNGEMSSFVFPTAGQHTVTLVSESQPGSCRDVITKLIYVDYNPVPAFIVDKPNGCPELCVKLNNLTSPITGPETNVTWIWSFGDGTVVTSTLSTVQEHCYTNNSSNQIAQFDVKLIVITSAGCKDSLTKNSFITVFPVPIAQYTINPNPGSVVTPLSYFTNESIDYTRWQWHFGDGPKIDSTNLNPVHNYLSDDATSYYTSLTVINQYGCRDTAKIKLDIAQDFAFYIPNAFTPGNEDGINDMFTGKGIGIVKYEMWIFNRWGESIFYSDDIVKGWDGRVLGKQKEVQQDVYVWKVRIINVLGKKMDYIGHVTIVK